MPVSLLLNGAEYGDSVSQRWPVILENLQTMLEEQGSVEVMGTAASQRQACDFMDGRTQGCDVAVINLFLSSGNGLGVLEHIAAISARPSGSC